MKLDSPVLIVSPHFDDAVLGCGRLIAAHPGSIVVTVFGGRPEAQDDDVTPWDAAGGFAAGDDPVTVRRGEDSRALAVLGAGARWLEFVDHQYRHAGADLATISAALAATLAEVQPATVVAPLGLTHPDHLACAEAVRTLDLGGRLWLVYEDGLYRRRATAAQRAAALAPLTGNGRRARACHPPLDPTADRKREAIACYRSQVRALLRHRVPALAEAEVPERYWRIQ